LTGQAYDPETTTPSTAWSYRPVVGVDAGAACSFGDPTAAYTTITCTDDGIFEVTLAADDGVNAPARDIAVVAVSNVAPVLDLTEPSAWQVYRAGETVSLAGSFTDPGTNDTHTCDVGWDDGGTDRFKAVDHACARTHVFPHAGTYTLDITVTDDDGASDSANVMVIVYDPDGGFATAGGWLDSPSGSYPADPTAGGRLYLTAHGKYKSDVLLDAMLRVRVAEAGLDIHTDEVEWMVVTPDGKLAIKAAGETRDGRRLGMVFYGYDGCGDRVGEACQPGVDRMRVVVWDLADGAIPEVVPAVYDNRPGESFDVDEADPTSIGRGSVRIHQVA
jgi:hypothetical protein